MSNYNGAIAYSTDTYQARKGIQDRIDYVLDLMDKERNHADTHSARNHYQAVIRLELQALKDDLSRTQWQALGKGGDQIPS